MKSHTDLRLTRSECPMLWLSPANVNQLQELHDSIQKWYHDLPQCLEWKGSGIDSLIEPDFVVRHMRVLTRLEYLYLQLRLDRGYLILNLRLLSKCCHSMPHMNRRGMNDPDTPSVFDTIRIMASRCVKTAQSIIKIFWKPSGNGKDDILGDIYSSEKVDMIYSAALVLIAGRMIPYIVEESRHVLPPPKSLCVLGEQIRQADVMLRNCEENCNQCPDFGQRIRRSRAFLDFVNRQPIPFDNIAFPVTDEMLNIGRPVWANLYTRLGVDLQFEQSEEQFLADQIPGKQLLLCWVESLPIDFGR